MVWKGLLRYGATMDLSGYVGRAMPVFVLLPMILIGLLAVLALTRKLPTPAGRLLVIVVGLRPLLSAGWQFTFNSSPAGLTWNALSSVIFLAAGLFVLRRRSISLLVLAPFVPLLVVAATSGILNHAVSELASYVTKFGYVIVVALLVIEAAEDHGVDAVMRVLVLALLSPLVFQAVGTPLGVVKASEADGSAAYLGGFIHESAFSMLLCGTMLAICLVRRMDFRLKLLLIGWCAIGIMLGNYRTALIAVVPLVGVSLLVDGMRRFIPEQRVIVGAMLAVLIASAGLGIAVTQQERFSDLGVFLNSGTSLIKPPDTFTVDERHVLNGRPLIWAEYYFAWEESSPRQHVVGMGPETWSGKMKVYAHNTLVSALYEVGLAGVVCYLLLWAWFLGLAFLVPGPARWIAIAGQFSFFLLNMATMPMWSIEGLIYYGLLCGYTAHMVRSRRASGPRVSAPFGRSPLTVRV